MAETMRDGLCIASALAGIVLVMGAEGGEKAGMLTKTAGGILLLVGLLLLAVPVLVCWRADKAAEKEDNCNAKIDNERSNAA